MTISVVFDPPLRSDSPAVFNSKAFTLVGDLNKWSNEANALASDVTSKQTTASNAATTATNQADLANSSRIAAQDAAAAAAASYDSFDDRYLGAKASDPTLDNDGNALIEGALYWNSTVKEHRTWNGTAWVTTSVANAVSRGGDTMTGNLTVPSLNGGQLAGHRNKLINGSFEVIQRGTGSVADDAYCFDRWYVLTETGNVTVAQLTDPESGAPWGIRLTQPDATAKRIGFAQIIESKNIRQFASKAMNLSARLRLSTAANIRYAVIEHTGDADVVTSDVVNNWASATFTPSNFFIAGVNIISTGTIAPGAATWGEVSDWDALGAGVKNVIVFVWTESQVAQNVTLDCSRIQYEPGVVATPHEWRMDEQGLCVRYARPNGALAGWSTSTTTLDGLAVDFGSTPMFASPALTLANGTGKGLDPGVAFRDISAPSWTGTSRGGYVNCTIAATTANKLHNVLAGAFLFTAEL